MQKIFPRHPICDMRALAPATYSRRCYDVAMVTMRVGVLTVSDRGSRGEREDTSGAAIRELVVGNGGEVVRAHVTPDERDQISAVLREWCDAGDLDVVLTTGGTGLAARDVTPEATLDVAERLVPGVAEAMRAEGLRHTPRAMLSRGVAVMRGHTLIVNLPGSEKGVRESLGAVLEVLPHAVELLRGHTEHA
jgi:molybdenum cofactor synthesis domain-containing protein